MAKRRFHLTHQCNKKGCEGNIGDVIEVSDADLKFLEERKGGYEVDADGKWIDKSAAADDKAEGAAT